MQRIDLLIGLALGVAILGSVVGVLTYEDGRLSTLRVTWGVQEIESLSEPAQHTGPGEVELPIEVTAANLTGGEVRVSVAGQAARALPVAIRVEVRVPGANETFAAEGELPAGPAGSTEIVVPVALRAAPQADTVRAASVDAARAQLAAEHASAVGTGVWSVVVSLAPGAPGPLGNEAFTLEARALLETYAAEVTPVTPEVEGR